jgi:hypothetical protein
MTIDYEAAKRSLIATRRKNVQAAVDELVYDAERSAAEAWANYDRAKDYIKLLEHKRQALEFAIRTHYGTCVWLENGILQTTPYDQGRTP